MGQICSQVDKLNTVYLISIENIKGRSSQKMRRRIGRKTGSLILAAALIAVSAQPVMAEQGRVEAQGQISARVGEAADMPAVETDEVTWTGGKLKIPVSLGGYSADELIVVLNEKNENGLVISSRLLDIEGENAVCDMVSFVDVTGEEWGSSAFISVWSFLFSRYDTSV